MKAFTTDHIVLQQDWTTYDRDCPRGSGYCADQGRNYILFKRFYLWGWKFWTREVDREELPSHVWITQVCLRSSGNWKSKFAEYMK